VGYPAPLSTIYDWGQSVLILSIDICFTLAKVSYNLGMTIIASHHERRLPRAGPKINWDFEIVEKDDCHLNAVV